MFLKLCAACLVATLGLSRDVIQGVIRKIQTTEVSAQGMIKGRHRSVIRIVPKVAKTSQRAETQVDTSAPSFPSLEATKPEAGELNDHKDIRTAYCVVGDMRTFPLVGHTLARFLRGTDGVGLSQMDGPDVFFTLGLRDDPNFPFMYDDTKSQHSEAEVQNLVELLKPVHVEYLSSHGEATADNVHSKCVAAESQDCFNGTGWDRAHHEHRLQFGTFWAKANNFARSMNQLDHIKKCLSSVKSYEEKVGKKYAVVGFGRPDLNYGGDDGIFKPTELKMVAAGQVVIRTMNDYMAIFSRDIMDNFFTKTGPLGVSLLCTPGQACCGRVTRSEDMFSWILGNKDEWCRCVVEKDPVSIALLGVCVRRQILPSEARTTFAKNAYTHGECQHD